MSTAYTSSPTEELDALIVGAGFGGVHQLYNLRKLGLNAKIFEAGGGMGGTWYWNRYPGARVDSDLPIYQFSMEELWRDWNWSEKFPGWKELQEYFRYVDKKLDLSRDIYFNSRVESAQWDSTANHWSIKIDDGRVIRAQFFLVCTGIGSKYYIPEFKGLESFQGICHHTARWPEEGVDIKGKRVGVIGTGATGVQVIQEFAPDVAHLTVFQRTPNLALPMNQAKITEEEQTKMKDLYPTLFRRRLQTFFGFTYNLTQKETLSVSVEERTLYWEDLWQKGGFRFWLEQYGDIYTNKAANDEAYAFWRKKVRARIDDPEFQEKLAPMIPRHPFGMKRPSLEQRYYEVYNQPNVSLVDISNNPIAEITPKGVRTIDGVEYELDVLVLATGFDMVTGGITQIDIRGTDGVPIREKWSDGVCTYLGMSTSGCPNMFFLYGPHGPSAFCNGPSCAEMQSEWILKLIKHMRENGIETLNPIRASEVRWCDYVQEISKTGLWSMTKSWYMGANIPGKKVEALNYMGGVSEYHRLISEEAENGYKGFEELTRRSHEKMLS